MILVDTSAWVEFLRDTGSPVCQCVDDLLAAEIATCDAVRMEVLAGARNEQHLHRPACWHASDAPLFDMPVRIDTKH